MAKRTNTYEIVDENKTVIATTSNYKEAKKMLMILARYMEWNRNIKITGVKERRIIFDNNDYVFLRHVNYFSSAKDMALAYDFQDFVK